ncbi:hypothetical protein SDC9_75045 [bioreactor metagenome]|uniref:Uncharacterized protein n=1 Tax=bioreactor metagenome TaxID=1076179 RepID=A0A644YJK5_9ZZZZ
MGTVRVSRFLHVFFCLFRIIVVNDTLRRRPGILGLDHEIRNNRMPVITGDVHRFLIDSVGYGFPDVVVVKGGTKIVDRQERSMIRRYKLRFEIRI